MKGNLQHATSITGVLTAATRMRNTFGGDPQWKLTVRGYVFRTHPDATHVGSRDFSELVNTEVCLRLNDHNRVIDLFTPRTLNIDSIVHLPRHLEQLPIGSQVQVTTGVHAIYTKRSSWQWVSGPVSINPELLLSRFRKLRVVRLGEEGISG